MVSFQAGVGDLVAEEILDVKTSFGKDESARKQGLAPANSSTRRGLLPAIRGFPS